MHDRCLPFTLLFTLLLLTACAFRTPALPAITVVPTQPAQAPLFPTLTPTAAPDIIIPTLDPQLPPTSTPAQRTDIPPTATIPLPRDVEIPTALELIPCDLFEIRRVSPSIVCGYVSVPEEHTNPDNPKTIRLAVVIYYGPTTANNRLPLVMEQGGPGGSTLYLFGNSTSFLVPQLALSRDIVLIEQRGTRFSQPFLYCDEIEYFLLDTLDDPAGYEDVFEKQDAVQRCYDRLKSEGVNLGAYNSVENAHDIAYVTAALGYDKFDFYGVSYGALLGQHLLKWHPDRLRSVVLDSVVPMATNWIVEAPRSANRAFQQIFAACGADFQCNSQYPQLEETFLSTVLDLNAHPQLMVITSDTRFVNVRLTGDLFIRVLYDALYRDSGSIPKLITLAANGQFETLKSQVVPNAVESLAVTNGMYASTMCAEDGDYTAHDYDLTGLHSNVARVIAGTADNDLLELCPVWQVPPLTVEVDEPVVSDVPTLLLSGTFDPITPTTFAAEVAASLSRSTLLVFPNQAHGLLFHSDCARRITSQFVSDPTATLDVTCIARAGQSFR